MIDTPGRLTEIPALIEAASGVVRVREPFCVCLADDADAADVLDQVADRHGPVVGWMDARLSTGLLVRTFFIERRVAADPASARRIAQSYVAAARADGGEAYRYMVANSVQLRECMRQVEDMHNADPNGA